MMKIVDLISFEAQQSVIEQCAQLYCQVWKEEPWNEDFWAVPEVIVDMKKEFSRKNAHAFLAADEKSSQIVGFTWGYEVSREEMRSIANGNSLDDFLDENTNYFYIDELGVDAKYRIGGIGKELSRSLIFSAMNCEMDRILLRTDEKALAARILYAKLGFEELPARDAKYPERTYWIKDISVEISCR